MPQQRVACILVNFNNWQDTAACLTALKTQTLPLTVLVVDNASANDSLTQLRAAHPWPTYIPSPTNLGFPRACNLAARHPAALAADLLWFLNNDTIAPPDTLSKLLATAHAAPHAGIIGAVLYYAPAATQIQAWGGGTISRWTTFSRHFTGPTPLTPTSYITFASALILRPLWDQLNGLTEDVFMYFEDADFALRARAAGSSLAVAPDTAILHREGGSAAAPHSPFLERVTTSSGLVFLRRHAPIPALAYALFLAARILKRLLTARFRALPPILAGLRDFLTHRPYPLP